MKTFLFCPVRFFYSEYSESHIGVELAVTVVVARLKLQLINLTIKIGGLGAYA